MNKILKFDYNIIKYLLNKHLFHLHFSKNNYVVRMYLKTKLEFLKQILSVLFNNNSPRNL